MPKPTAATFFAQSTTANKNKVQAVLDSIAAGAAREKILSEVTSLGAQMNAVEREQLVSLAYQQLAAR